MTKSAYLFRIALSFAMAAVGVDARADSPDSVSPRDMAECANIAVSMAKSVDGVTLDYSADSLSYVDKTLNYFHTVKLKNENVETAIGGFGCYVGEVFVRDLKGSWLLPTQAEKAVLGDSVFVKLPGGVVVNPIGKVHKLVENGMEDSVVWLYKVSERKSR